MLQPPARCADAGQATRLANALRQHFSLSAQSARGDLADLLWQGRLSLLIGCCFVAACILLADFLRTSGSGPVTAIFREGLTIIGVERIDEALDRIRNTEI